VAVVVAVEVAVSVLGAVWVGPREVKFRLLLVLLVLVRRDIRIHAIDACHGSFVVIDSFIAILKHGPLRINNYKKIFFNCFYNEGRKEGT